MRNCIGSGFIGPWPFVDISAQEFELVKTAKHNLFVLLGVEEKFNLVIGNYLEYEQELLNLALVHMASHNPTWSSFHDAKALINRRLANLLTVSRLYIDQVKHDISSIYGKNASTTIQVRQAFSEQYDRLFGYRVME